MPESCHLPIQNPDHAGLGGMEDEIVDFIVSMDDGGAILGLRFRSFEEGENRREVRNRTNGSAGVDVLDSRLSIGDLREGSKLAIVKILGLAKGGQIDRGGRYAMEICQCVNCGFPPGDLIREVCPARLILLTSQFYAGN